jgi:hypothetical protein
MVRGATRFSSKEEVIMRAAAYGVAIIPLTYRWAVMVVMFVAKLSIKPHTSIQHQVAHGVLHGGTRRRNYTVWRTSIKRAFALLGINITNNEWMEHTETSLTSFRTWLDKKLPDFILKWLRKREPRRWKRYQREHAEESDTLSPANGGSVSAAVSLSGSYVMDDLTQGGVSSQSVRSNNSNVSVLDDGDNPGSMQPVEAEYSQFSDITIISVEDVPDLMFGVVSTPVMTRTEVVDLPNAPIGLVGLVGTLGTIESSQASLQPDQSLLQLVYNSAFGGHQAAMPSSSVDMSMDTAGTEVTSAPTVPLIGAVQKEFIIAQTVFEKWRGTFVKAKQTKQVEKEKRKAHHKKSRHQHQQQQQTSDVNMETGRGIARGDGTGSLIGIANETEDRTGSQIGAENETGDGTGSQIRIGCEMGDRTGSVLGIGIGAADGIGSQIRVGNETGDETESEIEMENEIRNGTGSLVRIGNETGDGTRFQIGIGNETEDGTG